MPDSQLKTTSEGGKHKIFLSYAPGVGKTHAMLEEASRRRKRGQDVVAGLIAAHLRPSVEELLTGIEVVPPLMVNGVPEVDVDAIIARHPEVVLVDDLQHTNSPGSKREKRWQDVQA